ncbi:MAG: DUF2240 family protein [Candidatus Methanoperedens sp.]|nr:DUF2240 family protein [Candidatus Methanoperedens sp.]MCE8426203.1 DUF2240 family protein [Candidatus Methanoperedens sp.]
MSDLIYTVSMPFKRKGKDALKESEFILVLSLDLNWFAPDQAKNILSEAKRRSLIIVEGDLLKPSFDLASVEIPSGFNPGQDIFEIKTIFERTIDRIIVATGIEKRKIISLINKKQEDLLKIVEIDVSAILVALENGVLVDDLIKEEYEALFNPLSSSSEVQ